MVFLKCRLITEKNDEIHTRNEVGFLQLYFYQFITAFLVNKTAVGKTVPDLYTADCSDLPFLGLVDKKKNR